MPGFDFDYPRKELETAFLRIANVQDPNTGLSIAGTGSAADGFRGGTMEKPWKKIAITFENVPDTADIIKAKGKNEKDTGTTDLDIESLWCRLTIRMGNSAQISLAPNPYHRYPVNCILQIFTPRNAGTVLSLATAQRFADEIKRVDICEAEIRSPYEGARTIDDDWFMYNLIVPTIFDLQGRAIE